MIASINSYIDLVAAIEYVVETNDIAAISMADRGEALRMLEERGVTLESAGRGVICFTLDRMSIAIDAQKDSAIIRKMDEEDFENVLLDIELSIEQPD